MFEGTMPVSTIAQSGSFTKTPCYKTLADACLDEAFSLLDELNYDEESPVIRSLLKMYEDFRARADALDGHHPSIAA